jgi:hypothetical protein
LAQEMGPEIVLGSVKVSTHAITGGINSANLVCHERLPKMWLVFYNYLKQRVESSYTNKSSPIYKSLITIIPCSLSNVQVARKRVTLM